MADRRLCELDQRAEKAEKWLFLNDGVLEDKSSRRTMDRN